MSSFEAEFDIINLVYYVSLQHKTYLVTDQYGVNSLETSARVRLVNGQYCYVKGLDRVKALFIELEIDTSKLLDEFRYVVDSYKGAVPLQLTELELEVMNNVY